MADKTPREEFEQMFGGIIDEQWQWLKEFVERNHIPQPPVGFRVNGRVYHPDDVKEFVEIDGQFHARSQVEVILADTPKPLTKAERIERIRAINEERKRITMGEIISISLDPHPNAFGYGIDHATLFIEPEMRRTDAEADRDSSLPGETPGAEA